MAHGAPDISWRWLNLLASPGASDAPNAPSTGTIPALPTSRLTRDAFASLYQTHHRALWCIAAAIVSDKTAAYDIVQEAAMTALGKLDEFDPATSFPAWAGQIVRFVALNHRRRTIRSKTVPSDPTILAATSRASPASPVSDLGFSAQLSAALDDLDETARACLLMRTVMDMSYKQIAEALDIPEGTAMSHAHRSRLAMRRKLESAHDHDSRRSGGDQ